MTATEVPQEVLDAIEAEIVSREEVSRKFAPPPLPQGVVDSRTEFGGDFPINTPDPKIPEQTLERGWMTPAVTLFDGATWGRWDYWYMLQTWQSELPAAERKLPPIAQAPIPHIAFEEAPFKHGNSMSGSPGARRVRKMLDASLDCIEYGQGRRNWDYLLDWIRFGLGWGPDAPAEPAKGASWRLYQTFNVCAMQLYPADYFGAMLNEEGHGRGRGFFVTPLEMVRFIVDGTFLKTDGDPQFEDQRLAVTLDPCTGTGRFALEASNRTLRLHAIDLDQRLIKAASVNAYLYAPWLAHPIRWLHAAYPFEPVVGKEWVGGPGVAAGLSVRDFFEVGAYRDVVEPPTGTLTMPGMATDAERNRRRRATPRPAASTPATPEADSCGVAQPPLFG